MNAEHRLRVAVIGVGPWGANHVRVIASEGDCEVVAVVDPSEVARGRARGLVPEAAAYGDPDHVFRDNSIDAVVIATSAASHAVLTCAALGAGKHVLVEKPLAMSLEHAYQVERAAHAANRIAMVGHLMVYHPATVRLRELLMSGELGKLRYLHSTRVNLGRLRQDENALWSFGPHDLSIVDSLFGETPLSITARGQQVLQPGIEDVVALTMRFAGGEMAYVHLSWLSPRKERRVTVVCSQKMVEFDDIAAEKLKIYDKGYDRPPEFTEYSQYLTLRDGDVHIPQLPMSEPLRLQWRNFVDCIRQGRQPVASIGSGIRVTATLEAAQRSLELDGSPILVGRTGTR